MIGHNDKLSIQEEELRSLQKMIIRGQAVLRNSQYCLASPINGLYMDATYKIMDLNFDDIRKYAIFVENILTLNKEGQIIVLDRSDREESAKRANLLKNLYLVSNMVIETDKLIIRNVAQQDGEAFIQMASDGSLNDIGFEKDCSSWMDELILSELIFETTDTLQKQ